MERGRVRWRRLTTDYPWASNANRLPFPSLLSAALSLVLLLVAAATVAPADAAHAASHSGIAPDASCAVLAGVDPTASNGANWGRTIMPGHGKVGGWFGVDVCDNGLNASGPNSANVSCDHAPANLAKTGCAPGYATSDGYGLTFQCVELVIRFSAWAFGDQPSAWSGNAPDLWLPGNHPSDFVMYPNGSDHAPVPGDILVWGNVDAHGQPMPAGTAGAHGGHIAVVAAVKNGEVITAEQNVKWGDQDHASDRLALVHVGNQWILSGSIYHDTRLPTYRWQRTMGTERATYGWLHSTRNTGKFPSPGSAHVKSSGHSSTTSSSSQAPLDKSGGLPSLAASPVVTTDGVLADLTWTKNDRFATTDDTTSASSSATVEAQARSLGAPSGVRLAAGQQVATVVLSSGVRDAYVAGTDGHLYQARTGPRTLGVLWSDLGAPDGVQVEPSVSATAFAGGLAVAVMGSDGNLWWRAGPERQPGGWQELDHPLGTSLGAGFAIVGAPGLGSPLVLALGTDGKLYERLWQDAVVAGDGSVQAPAGWSEWLTVHAQPAGVNLTGSLLVISETANVRALVGPWADAPLDVLFSDTIGNLWWLRSTSLSSGWKLLPVAAPTGVKHLLGAVAVADAPAAPSATGSATTPASAGAKAAKPTPSATPASGASAGDAQAKAALLHLYVAAGDTPYLGALHIQQHAGDPVKATTWTKLATVPTGATSALTMAAVALAPAMSALVAPSGNEVLVGGTSDAVQALTAGDSGQSGDTQAAPAKPHGLWASAGSVAAAPAFSDDLAAGALDTRWSLTGTGAHAKDTASGAILTPGASGAAALLQGAVEGDATVAVRVTLPAQRPASPAHAGLVLYLDDTSWLTLLVDGAGHTQLCEEALQQTTPCATKSLQLDAKSHTVWLRIVRRGGMYIGESSTDGAIWHVVGQWMPVTPAATAPATTSRASTPAVTPSITPSPSPASGAPTSSTASPKGGSAAAAAPTAGDAPLAPLAFSEWGVYVDGAATGFVLRDFTVTPPLDAGAPSSQP